MTVAGVADANRSDPDAGCGVSFVMRKAVVALALIASPALAQNAPIVEGEITCSSPIAPEDSAKRLQQRYGQDAVIQQLPGAEGETYKGLVLLPRAMDRRIEVSFKDDSLGRVTGLILRDTAKKSRWNVAGLSIGSSLADVQKVNGKPFLVNGFEWDYGGYVVDWKGGTLGRPLQGGCKVTLRFGNNDAVTPKGFLGEGVKISSDNATLVKWGPVVTEIGMSFPGR